MACSSSCTTVLGSSPSARASSTSDTPSARAATGRMYSSRASCADEDSVIRSLVCPRNGAGHMPQLACQLGWLHDLGVTLQAQHPAQKRIDLQHLEAPHGRSIIPLLLERAVSVA